VRQWTALGSRQWAFHAAFPHAHIPAFLPTPQTSATLAVPLDALGGQYLTTIDRQLGPLPAALMDLLTGRAPGCYAVPGLEYLQLAALLLWIKNGHGVQVEATQTVFAWQQYIAHVLPTMSDLTCLLTFNDQEVAQLQDSELKGEATRQRAWAIELHKAWLAPLGLAFGINDSLWALGQVRSRSFEFGLRSGVRVFLIAPFMDLANHCHRNFNCEPVMEEGNGRVILQPTKSIFVGDEILINYSGESSSSNVDLLTNYGFIQPGNPYDTVPLITSQMQLRNLPPIELNGARAATDFLIARLKAARQRGQQAFPVEHSTTPATVRILCALNSLQAAAMLQHQHLQAKAEFQSRRLERGSIDWPEAWLCQVNNIMSAKDGLGATSMKKDAALLLGKPYQLEEASLGGKDVSQKIGTSSDGEVLCNRFADDNNIGARRKHAIVTARLERKAIYAHVANILKAVRHS